MSGFVFFIGAGPGDVELMTLRGKKALEEAQVVFYDQMWNTSFLHFAPEAEHIFVGKKGYSTALSQEETTALIIRKAREGKKVARLKSDDPLLFGRGSEEMEACVRANIDFSIIPGITSALAAPAYAGIPITHPKIGSTFAVINKHEVQNKLQDQALNSLDTLIFLINLTNIAETAQGLILSGRASTTPVAVICGGTTSQQKTVVGELHNIAAMLQASQAEVSCVLVVGKVVQLRETLQWLENRPLWGKKIVITRTREGSSTLGILLQEKGAEVLELPLLHYARTSKPQELQQKMNNLKTGDWTIFTSSQGVKAFFEECHIIQRDVRTLAGVRFAAIGPATAQELRSHGIRADFVPSHPGAIYLGKELPVKLGEKIVHFTSNVPEDDMYTVLSNRDIHFQKVEAYVTLPAHLTEHQKIQLNQAELVTLVSAGAAQAFVDIAGANHDAVVLSSQAYLAAQKAGFKNLMLAKTPNLPAMVEAIEEYFAFKG